MYIVIDQFDKKACGKVMKQRKLYFTSRMDMTHSACVMLRRIETLTFCVCGKYAPDSKVRLSW